MPLAMPARSLRSVVAVLVLAAALPACVGDGSVKSAAEATGFATTPQEPRNFVIQSRPASTDYIPVGRVVTREAKRKTVDEFKTLEATLEAKRQANEAAGTRARALGTTAAPKPAVVPPTN